MFFFFFVFIWNPWFLEFQERERSTREELRLLIQVSLNMVSHVRCFLSYFFSLENCLFGGVLIQKQKQNEEELVRRVQDLQAELVSSNELREKLERKVCEFLWIVNFTVMCFEIHIRDCWSVFAYLWHLFGCRGNVWEETSTLLIFVLLLGLIKLRFSLSGYQMM